jgi:hypothetical protein
MRRLSFAILAFFPFAAAAQNAKPPSAAESALIETNATLARALATGDTAVLGPLLAGDLVYTDASGSTQSRAQLLSAVASGFRMQGSTPEVTRVHVDGNLGLLDFQSRVGSPGGDSAVVQTSAIYVLRAKRWQLTSLQSRGGPAQPARIPAPTVPMVTPSLPIPIKPTDRAPTIPIDQRMTTRATGTFLVDTRPLTAYNTATAAGVGRLSIDKQYHGDIEGTGKGEMLTAGNPASGSAGYVAIEYVTATIRGKNGGFALQHSGTMDKGALSLTVTVVPGSGTGGLAGIAGTMNIIVESGKHSYIFDYSLPGAE